MTAGRPAATVVPTAAAGQRQGPVAGGDSVGDGQAMPAPPTEQRLSRPLTA